MLCVVATLFIGNVVFTGTQEIKRLKEELEGMGYDTTPFGKLNELKFLRKAVDEGNIDESLDRIWYAKAVNSAAIGDLLQVQKMKAYWKNRGVTIKTLADLDKLTVWMVKKYPNMKPNK